MQDKLWDDYKRTGDCEPLIKYYQKFALNIARKRHKTLPSFVSVEDLEASALVGLWKAIEKFDPTMGVEFQSFAQRKILGAILDDIRDEDHSSRTLRDKQKEIKAAEDELSSILGRKPSQEELAAVLDTSIEDLNKYERRIHEARVVSIDAPTGEDNVTTIGDTLTIEEDNSTIDRQNLIETALAPLSKREKLLFILMYFEDLALDQCALIMRMTHPMVCQLHFRLADRLEERLQASRKKTND